MNFTPFSALLPQSEILLSETNLLATARKNFPQYREDGLYYPATAPAFFILKIMAIGQPASYGIAGLINTDDYGGAQGIIRPHEATLAKREEKQRASYLETKSMIKPILLSCPPFPHLHAALINFCDKKPPATAYHQDGVAFSIFPVFHPQEQAHFLHLVQHSPRPIALADGHHRIATAQALHQSGEHGTDFAQIPGLIMTADSLSINAYIRSLTRSDEQTGEGIMEKLRNYFEVVPLAEPKLPTQAGEWVMGLEKQYFSLLAKRTDHTVIDAVWFNNEVLPTVFEVHDSSRDPRLNSTDAGYDLATLQKLTAKKPEQYHFLGLPVTYPQFFDCLIKGELFPPKTTRFVPRIPSGLLVYERK